MECSCVWHDSCTCETWPLHIGDRRHSYVFHHLCICAPWLAHKWTMTPLAYRERERDTHTCTHTHTHAWQLACGTCEVRADLFILLHMSTHLHITTYYYTCLCMWVGIIHMCGVFSHMCNMTPSNMGHNSFTCGTGHIYMSGMTPSHVKHDSFTSGIRPLHMCAMTLSYMCRDLLT